MKIFLKTLLSIVISTVLLTQLLIFPSFVDAQEPLIIDEFPIPTAASYTTEITAGPDGNLWFIEGNANKIGKITPSGTITEFTLSVLAFGAFNGIAAGTDGNIWFTESHPNANKIGRITPSGTITEFPIPTSSSLPYSITVGPDGNLWFAEYGGHKIGRITPDGIITEFPVASVNGEGPYVYDITAGPDGNLWFTESNPAVNKIGRITPGGIITEFLLPTAWASPQSIATGPDGNVWFTEYLTHKIAKITPNGVITEFYLNGGAAPHDITAGPDGNVWFTKRFNNNIGKITPSGTITEYSIPTSDYRGITLGPDNNLWITETTENKIVRVTLPLTSEPTIADFKQTDPQWSTIPSLPDNVLTHIDHSLDCGDIYGYGCAVTSTANVFYSYGKTFLPGSIQLNPGSLNDLLTGHNGFSSCSIIWGNASSAIELGAPAILFRNNSIDWTTGQQEIDNALNEGNLPIVGVTTNFGTHFFVVSHKLPDVNGKPDYSIIDPALYPFIFNNPGNSGKPLSQTYGGFDKVFETVIYRKGSSPQKTLTIRGHSPIQLLITDPLGNMTGYDESTQEIMENIQESSYGTEPGIAPIDGQSSASYETKYFQQIDPSEGEYIVQVIGTGNGSYTLDFSKTDEQGNVSTKVVEGFAQNDVTETYNFQYTPNATESPVINREVTFSVLKSDLKGLYSQDQIKNKGIYTLLKLEVEAAEKASLINRQPLGNKLAILVLKTSLFQLKAQRGKQITEDAYQLIYKDVNSLIQSLQGDSSGYSS